MRLVTCSAALTLSGQIQIPANTRCVMCDHAAYGLAKVMADKKRVLLRVSGMGNYTRRYCGQDLAGKTLISWRGHGLGDQMVWAGLLAILKARYPTARIVTMLPPPVQPLWLGADATRLPFQPVTEPLAMSAWQQADYHLIGEDLVEADAEPDQRNIWDSHLWMAGIDPESVPAADKRPIAPLSHAARKQVADWLQCHGRTGKGGATPLIVYQVAASTPIRSQDPKRVHATVRALLAAFPGALVVLIGSPAEAGRFQHPAFPAGAVRAFDQGVPAMIAFAEAADLVICPDSALGHAAAAFGTPCVSLWSSFLPQDRVSTYPCHLPLKGAVDCSPCRAHESGPNARGCPRRKLTGSLYCRGIDQITPDDIVAASRTQLGLGPSHQPATKE